MMIVPAFYFICLYANKQFATISIAGRPEGQGDLRERVPQGRAQDRALRALR